LSAKFSTNGRYNLSSGVKQVPSIKPWVTNAFKTFLTKANLDAQHCGSPGRQDDSHQVAFGRASSLLSLSRYDIINPFGKGRQLWGMSVESCLQFCLLRPAQASYIIRAQDKSMVAFIDPQRDSGRSLVFAAYTGSLK
jgi:hypothetical protein